LSVAIPAISAKGTNAAIEARCSGSGKAPAASSLCDTAESKPATSALCEVTDNGPTTSSSVTTEAAAAALSAAQYVINAGNLRAATIAALRHILDQLHIDQTGVSLIEYCSAHTGSAAARSSTVSPASALSQAARQGETLKCKRSGRKGAEPTRYIEKAKLWRARDARDRGTVPLDDDRAADRRERVGSVPPVGRLSNAVVAVRRKLNGPAAAAVQCLDRCDQARDIAVANRNGRRR
jgi:hypothetical protein